MTKDQWLALARGIIPELPEYASWYNCAFDDEEALFLLEKGDIETLHSAFEKLWSDLPDHPSIHRYPFGHLCDLCSEYNPEWADQ